MARIKMTINPVEVYFSDQKIQKPQIFIIHNIGQLTHIVLLRLEHTDEH